MPHFIVEYSDNLSRHADMEKIMDVLYDAVLSAGVFQPAATRIRAYPSRSYRIADRHADNAFIYVHGHIGAGRDEETRARAGRHIFDRLMEQVKPLLEKITLGVTVEITELHPKTSFRGGNLHENFERRGGKADG